MKIKLEHQVLTAVGAILGSVDRMSLDNVFDQLPSHLKAANPSLKSITKAIVHAGFVGKQAGGGTVIYVRSDVPSEPGADHNGSEEGSVEADEMRLLLERAERLEDAKKELSEDIKDVWREAKARGYDAPALKGIMRLRGKKKEDVAAQQAILDTYMKALGMMA